MDPDMAEMNNNDSMDVESISLKEESAEESVTNPVKDDDRTHWGHFPFTNRPSPVWKYFSGYDSNHQQLVPNIVVCNTCYQANKDRTDVENPYELWEIVVASKKIPFLEKHLQKEHIDEYNTLMSKQPPQPSEQDVVGERGSSQRVKKPVERDFGIDFKPAKRTKVGGTQSAKSKSQQPQSQKASGGGKEKGLTSRSSASSSGSVVKGGGPGTSSRPNPNFQNIVYWEPTKVADRQNLRIQTYVTLSSLDRAPQLELSDDELECKGVIGGYRMVRASHGVHSGAYYFEVDIVPGGTNAHTRIGWSTRQGELQAPVGYDNYSFGYRDIGGSKVHKGVRDDKYGEEYGPGDIIGCYLHLDDKDIARNQMRFFKNGKDQGLAFSGKDIPPGVYFPAVSLYMDAAVRVNFGPRFILQHNIYGANAVSEVQPLSPEDRKIHEARILKIRRERLGGGGTAGASETSSLLLQSSEAPSSSSSSSSQPSQNQQTAQAKAASLVSSLASLSALSALK